MSDALRILWSGILRMFRTGNPLNDRLYADRANPRRKR